MYVLYNIDYSYVTILTIDVVICFFTEITFTVQRRNTLYTTEHFLLSMLFLPSNKIKVRPIASLLYS